MMKKDFFFKYFRDYTNIIENLDLSVIKKLYLKVKSIKAKKIKY